VAAVAATCTPLKDASMGISLAQTSVESSTISAINGTSPPSGHALVHASGHPPHADAFRSRQPIDFAA
jgi:hypothetical protein